MTQLECLKEPGYYLIKMNGALMGTPYTVGIFDGKALYCIGSMTPVLSEDVVFVSPQPIDLNKMGQEIEQQINPGPERRPAP